MNLKRLSLLVCVALAGAGVAHAAGIPIPPPQTGTPAYTQDTILSDFTDGVTNYGTFIGGTLNQNCTMVGCVSSILLSSTVTYLPDTASLTAPHSSRVVGTELTGNTPLNPIIVQFSAPVSQILVFNSIDHIGFSYDTYQYNVYGGNFDISNPNQVDFTLLFDPILVIGTNNPGTDPNFKLNPLNGWSGTGPTLVNNALTPGQGQFGIIGYEQYFHFSNAYQFYGFRTSTFATNNAGELEQELGAVAEASPTPEPTTWATVLIGFGIVGLQLWCRQRRPSTRSL
jgi:hypothetical protein